MSESGPWRGIHDIGGQLDEPFELTEHDYAPWEKRTHALRELLARKGLLAVDELRLAIESQSESDYVELTYYEQWITAMADIMVAKGIVDRDDLERAIDEARHV